MRPWRD